MKLVFASDSFKGSLSQNDIISLLEEATPSGWETLGIPVADGGEGTVDAVVSATGGTKRKITVHGPLMEPVEAEYALLPDGRALIEMAAASGLPLLPQEKQNPLYTTSFGFGELIADALLQGCRKITVGLGGSATNDGGMGALNALGWLFQDSYSNNLRPRGDELGNVARILYVDTANLFVNGWTDIPSEFNLRKALTETEFTIMCDVDNPLLGPTGATYTFGPQKGADISALLLLEDGMNHFAKVCAGYLAKDVSSVPGAGAAGGLGFALCGFLNGTMKSGIDAVLELAKFEEALDGATLCITGEGCLDGQSLHGKAVSGVASACRKMQVPCMAIVGKKGEGWEDAKACGIDAVFATSDLADSIEDAIKNAKIYYAQTAKRVMEVLPLLAPTRVCMDWFTVFNHSKELAKGKKALIVTGARSAEATGALKDVTRALKREAVDYVVYNKIEPNPSIEAIMDATAFGKEEGVDFVIGIGGGSPLDAAKAIALMLYHKDKDAEYLYREGDDTALPVVAVPTTCGTGSEVTGISVLTIHEKKTKGSMSHKVYPALAFIDPNYLTYAPEEVLKNTAMDALCHLFESYYNTQADEESRKYVRKGLAFWQKSKEVLLGERPAELPDYWNLMLASTWAGLAIAKDGTSLPHGLSYYLTYHNDIPHGKACGMFLAKYLEVCNADPELLRLAGFHSTEEVHDFFLRTCGKPSVTKDDLMATVQTLLDNPKKTARSPVPVSRELLEKIAGL